MRHKRDTGHIDYWPSFTDVITNLLLIFVFIFLVLIIKNYFDYKEIQRLKELSGKIENDLDALKNSFTGFTIEGPDQAGNLRIVLGEELVKFQSGKDLVPEDGKAVLKKAGDQIHSAFNKYPSLFTITIEGYTDTQDPDDDNYKLSFNRAKNVMYYWRNSCGLDPNKFDIMAAGFGEQYSKLKVKSKDKTPSAKNRRIEIRITPKFKDLMEYVTSRE